MIGLIEHFNTQLVTTPNYNASSNIHTLQITVSHAKSFPASRVFISSYLVTASNNGYSSLNGDFLPNELFCQSQSYFMTGDLPSVSSSSRQAPWESRLEFLFHLNTCCRSNHVTSSLTRGWVCRLQLLLVLSSAVILRSESWGTHDHILLSQIRDSPNLEGQFPVFISPRNNVAQLYPQVLGSLFIASYDSQGYGGGIRTRLHTGYDSRS
jgi:hypothetical protein